MKLEEYAQVIQKEIVIRFYPEAPSRWCARFDGGHVKEGIGLTGEYGDGSTPTEALFRYVDRIRGKVLVFDPMSPEKRREFGVPTTLED